MDDLLKEFLTETNENLDLVDVELVKFEREPDNADILNNIFRVVHTIKGTCGFIGLPRLASLAHAAETLMDRFREGQSATPEAVDVVIASMDRIKAIVAELDASGGTEPAGDDRDLIDRLEALADGAQGSPGSRNSCPGTVAPDGAPAPGEARAGVVSGGGSEGTSDDAPAPGAGASAPGQAGAADPGADVPRGVEDVSPDATGAALGGGLPAVSPEDGGSIVGPDGPVAEAAPAAAATGGGGEGDKRQPARGGSSGRVGGQSIRVNVEALEHLMTIVSELVLTRNQLLEIVRRSEDSEYKLPLQRLSAVTGELQQAVMNTRMQPIGNAWQKLPRLVRDLSNELGKEIELVMSGAETELDRQVLDVVKDPLTHLVRNCADHGLETPAARRDAGKPETGTIRVAAYHEGGHIIIEIGDDGKGIDVDGIKSKAVGLGLVSEAEAAQLSDVQAFRFIFHPGFSTARQVTSVSGRGVGMDVVRSNIESIGGSVDVRSRRGQGSVFFIRIPLTLAILTALIVEAGGERFAFPQIAVKELVRVSAESEHRVERLKGCPVLRLRQHLLPVVGLGEVLGLSPADRDPGADGVDGNGFVVVIQAGSSRFGILVDSVLQMEEIVVKPLSSMLRGVDLFSGSTILGDGRVIMILDPNGVGKAVSSLAEAAVESIAMAEEDDEEGAGQRRETQSLLLFRAGSADPKAVPVGLVTRIEDVKISSIECASGTPVLQYRDDLVPLVYFSDAVERRREGTQPVLIFSDNGRSMGLVVDEIVDIIDDHLDVQLPSDGAGVVGTAILDGRATEVLDVGHFLGLAFADWFVPPGRRDREERGRILLVDDSAFFRSLIEPVLSGAGYRVNAVGSAATALERMRGGERFDAVVSDIEMPEMDGFALARALNADPELAHVPVIALSGICTPEAIERGRAAGFSDYVAKFDRDGLVAAIEELAARDDPDVAGGAGKEASPAAIAV